MATNYTTKTAALKATKADINKLDAKKLLLNGKNILDYIGESGFDSYDTRDPQLKNDELDIWNTKISLSEEGHIEVKPHVHSVAQGEYDYSNHKYTQEYEGITENQHNTLKTAVKVIDNEVLGANDEHLMYWQTDGLTNAYNIFGGNDNNISPLTSFSSDLSSLTNGIEMFYNTSLAEWNNDLPNLTNGYQMFGRTNNLQTLKSNMPKLTNGSQMFHPSALKTFIGDLSSLEIGWEMFRSTKLESFSSNLSSLTNGGAMFSECKLDAQSVANIIHTLPTRESKGTISIGIGCDNTEADQLLFAQECDCETWQELLDDFSAKNWTVYFECNGKPTEAATYNMRRGETLPIYAKLEEVTDEKYAQYTSNDGSKFFNINYFHSTNGSTEGYDYFESLEMATLAYSVIPKS